VKRLETDESGREVTRVVVERHGETATFSGSIVVVSCGAINSAALLLRSASEKHPRGLANGSDVVGRHYMGHVNSVLMAISKCPNPTVFQKSLAVNDFYFGSKEWEHPMGHISFVGKLDGDALRGGAPALVPGWTLNQMGKHSLDFWLTSEDLPDPNNRVTLDRNGNIVLAYTPNNDEGHKRLIAKLKGLMQQQTKCGVHGHECHEGLFSRNPMSASVFRSQESHIKTGLYGLATIPRPPPWTRIAEPMKWTISTSWMVVSSHPAPR
jgi:hypothetical protein